MLKSKLIDTKYVDPKGIARTPNVITSITEDEIKEGRFSPEDILPATAVLVALSNAGDKFPIPYYADATHKRVDFDVEGSDYDVVNVNSQGRQINIGAVGWLLESWCLFDNNGMTVKTGSSDDHSAVYLNSIGVYGNTNYTSFGSNVFCMKDLTACNEVEILPDVIYVRQYNLGTSVINNSVVIQDYLIGVKDVYGSNSCRVRADSITLLDKIGSATIDRADLATLKKVSANSHGDISDVDSSATLSDLISSYNSLLAHLRTSGILKS